MLSMSRESTTERLCSSPAMALSKAFCFTILLHSWYFILASLSLGFTFTTWTGRGGGGNRCHSLDGQPPIPEEPPGALWCRWPIPPWAESDHPGATTSSRATLGLCHPRLSFYIPTPSIAELPHRVALETGLQLKHVLLLNTSGPVTAKQVSS